MTTENTDKVLVLTTDGKTKALRWLDYMLRSARGRLDPSVRIVICTDSPKAVGEVAARFGLSFGIEVVDVTATIRKTGMVRLTELSFHGVRISPLQMYRLALPLEPALLGYDRVVFSDTDVGFESEEWNRIFEEDLGDHDVLAVRDCRCRERVTKDRCRELAETAAYAESEEENRRRISRGEYYAAGLMVMNLRRLRTAYGDYGSFLRKMVDDCVSQRLPQLDQSLINLRFSIGEISPSYNAWASNSSPGMPVWMRHFPGPQKVDDYFYPPAGSYVPQDAVDIMYVVGTPSDHDDQELRWSLRSIAKYGDGVGRVIVVSPVLRPWLAYDVMQVRVPDLENAGYKHHNILHSIMTAVNGLNMHGEFLVSSDDHFYVRHTDFSRYPFNVRGWSIPEHPGMVPRSPTQVWQLSCSDTGRFLRERGLPTVNFQNHANAHWNADLLRDEEQIFRDAMELRYCVEPHVLMQNLWLRRQPDIPLAFRKDAKLKEFVGVDGSTDCISCYDYLFLDDGFIGFMDREFGDKCRYEKSSTHS